MTTWVPKWVTAAVVLLAAHVAGTSPVTFDDRAPDRVSLTTDMYELCLAKSNGAVLALRDRTVGVPLTLGSRDGCLWGALFDGAPPDQRWMGGCSFAAGWGNSFTYSWDAASSTLTLSYRAAANATQKVNATVAITAWAANYFDMRISIENRWGFDLTQVQFPLEWIFSDDEVEAAYMPFQLPGVRLRARFLSGPCYTVNTYPGLFAFADYLALDMGAGRLAMYTVAPSGPIAPVALGFVDDDEKTPHTFRAVHVFQTLSPNGSVYLSPTVRVRVGEPPSASVRAYRVDNRIDAYRSVRDKLGPWFDTIVLSPLVLADWGWFFQKPFRSGIGDLGKIAVPAIFHIVNTTPGGFDHSYPDFLPPDPRWGSTEDLAALAAAARARGLVFMPYTNPTWWNPDSPTLQNLPAPLGLADIAALDAQRQPVYEAYGAPPNANGGFVVCPHVPFVKERVADMIAAWRTEVPADLVFVDQIGARPWLRDYNPAAPNTLSYSQGWLEFVARHADRSLMTEDGWDRLAAWMVGFCGSPLTATTSFGPGTPRYGEGGSGNRVLGPGAWDPYPLAGWLLHDKVLTYQHNLEKVATATALQAITWNLAFGNMMSYLWPGLTSPYPQPGPERMRLAHLLQRLVAARYAGRLLDDFAYLTPDVTVSSWSDLQVIANWSDNESFELAGTSIVAGGYLARTVDGAVFAVAAADRFNGEPLSEGTHLLVVERSPATIRVHQPEGADGDLLIDGCEGGLVSCRAVGSDGAVIANVAATPVGSRLRFRYRQSIAGRSVDHFELLCRAPRPPRGRLPAVPP